MRLHILGSLLVGVTLAATTASADVHITMADGKVTVSAKNATVGQILNEWARVGQTRIVNIDRLPGTPVSIELTNLPEAQALDTVLRSASGYLAAPRAVALPNASAYDRIFVLATSSGTPARTTPAPPTQGAFVPPMFEPPIEDQTASPTCSAQVPSEHEHLSPSPTAVAADRSRRQFSGSNRCQSQPTSSDHAGTALPACPLGHPLACRHRACSCRRSNRLVRHDPITHRPLDRRSQSDHVTRRRGQRLDH